MDEIEHIVTFCKTIAKNYRKRNLNLTIGPFVPKHQTKFAHFNISSQWVDNTNEMIKKVKNSLKSHGSLHIGSLKWSLIQTILSTGSTSLSPVLEKISKTQGRYQDWVSIIGNPITFIEKQQSKKDLEIPLPLIG